MPNYYAIGLRRVFMLALVASICLVTRGAVAVDYYWTADGTTLGGSGTWDTTSSLWRSGSATGTLGVYTSASNSQVFLQGTSGTLSITGSTIQVSKVTVATSGTFTLAGFLDWKSNGSTRAIVVNPNSYLTYTGSNSGYGVTLTVSGAGTVNFTAANKAYGAITGTTAGTRVIFSGVNGLDSSGTAASLSMQAGTIFQLDANSNCGGNGNNNIFTLNNGASVDLRAMLTLTSATTTSGAAFNVTGTAKSMIQSTTGAGSISLNASRLFSVAKTNDVSGIDLEISAPMSGVSGFTKTGTGTLLLSGSNTYAGTTTISQGVLAAGSTTALGTGPLAVNSGTMDLKGYGLTVGALSGSSGGVITSGTAGAVTFTASSASNSTFGGTIQDGSGTVAFTKLGSGTLTLSGSNTYSGATTISGSGRIIAASANSLGTGSAVKVVGNNLVISSSGLEVAAGVTITGKNLELDGSAGRSQLFLNDNAVWAGNVTFTNGSQFSQIWPTGTNTFITGTISAPGTYSGGGLGVGLRGPGTATVSGPILAESNTVNVYQGTWTFTNPNNTMGSLSIRDTTAQIRQAGQLASGSYAGTIVFSNTTGLFDYGSSADQILSGVISGSGSVTMSGAGTLTLSSAANTYLGVTTVNAGVVSVANLANGGANSPIGKSSSAAANLVLGGGRLQYTGTSVTIDRGFTLTNSTTSTIDVSTAATSLTLSGSTASTSGALTKAGAGTLVLAGTAAYSGVTAINAGTLLFNNTAALYGGTPANWTAANLTTGSGATAAFTVSRASGFTAANLDTLLALGTGSTGFLPGSIVGVDTAGTSFSYASNIANPNGGANALGLVKLGSGVLTLSGSNTFTGATTVSAGVLAISDTTALPGWNASGRVVVSPGAGLAVGNAVSDASVTTLATTASNFQAGSSIGFDTSAGDRTFANSVADTAQGSLGLVKVGGNSLTLTASNGYTGPTTVSTGTLVLGNANALANSTLSLGGGDVAFSSAVSGRVFAVGGLTSGTVNLMNNAVSPQSVALVVGGNNASTTFAGSITGTTGGALQKAGTGTLTLTGSSNSYTGDTTVNGGTLLLGSAAKLYQVSPGTSKVTINSGATLSFTGDFGYTGVFGILSVSSGSNFVINGGTLQHYGTSNAKTSQPGAGRMLTIGASGATIESATPGQEFSIGYRYDYGSTLVSASGGTLTLTGSGNGDLNYGVPGTGGLVKNGSGTWRLTGTTSSYSGGTTLNAGTLVVGSTTALGSTSGALAMNGGTLDVKGYALTVGALSGSSGGAITSSAAGAVTFTASSASNSTFGGVIQDGSGTVAFSKSGGGTLALTGVNTYSGLTTISGGALSISGTGNLPNTSGFSLSSGGGLTYTGAAGTVAKDITVAVGTGSVTNSGGGLLTLAGTLSKNGTVLRLAGGQFNVTGQIVGANSGSDLVVDAATVTLSNTNSYNGPTFVQNAGTLILSVNNAIPSNSAVSLAGSTLTVGGYTNAIGSLATSGNSTINVSVSGGSTGSLSMGDLSFGGGENTLAVTMSSPTAMKYDVLSYSGNRTGTLTATGLNSSYMLVIGSASNSVISVQRRAEVGTVTATAAAASIITGGSTAIGYTVTNSAPDGAATLSFTSANVANVAGTSSGSVAAGSTSGTVSGLFFTGTSIGLNEAGSFTVQDLNALTTTGTGSVSVTVLDHATPAFVAVDPTATNLLLDFGTVDQSAGLQSLGYSLTNITSTFGDSLTAGLALTGFVHDSGDTLFATGLSQFANLPASGTNSYTASFTPSSAGTFSEVFRLSFSDNQSLAGAAQRRDLTVTMNVIVVPEPGNLAIIALAALVGGRAVWRRRPRLC